MEKKKKSFTKSFETKAKNQFAVFVRAIGPPFIIVSQRQPVKLGKSAFRFACYKWGFGELIRPCHIAAGRWRGQEPK